MSESITYEEELEISDLLYERQKVLKKQKDDANYVPTDDEARAVEDGDEAARRLCMAYMPLVYTVAWSILRRPNANDNGDISIDDLSQVGYLAMHTLTYSFDARGQQRNDEDAHPGRRFATYSRRHITREMKRYVAKQSTPLSAAAEAVMNARKFVMNRLSGSPSDDLPARAERDSKDVQFNKNVAALDRDMIHNVLGDEDEAYEVVDKAESKYAASLTEALVEVLGEDRADFLVNQLGVDRGLPRNKREMCDYLGTTPAVANQIRFKVYSDLHHPSVRYKLSQRFRGITGID